MTKHNLISNTVLALSLILLPCQAFGAANAFVEHAEKAQLKKNLPAVQNLGNFLTKNAADWGTHSYWVTDGGDNRMFSSVIETVHSDGPALTLMVISPAVGKDTPDYTYLRAYYVPKSLVDLREKDYRDWTYTGTMAKDVVTLEYNDLNVYLMPAGNGTMVFKREAGNGL
jgi:hypothetical protein